MENIYLSNTDPDVAYEKFISHFKKNSLKQEIVSTLKSLGRITSEPVYSKLSSPNFNASAMDGIAVIASKTFMATDNNPIRLKEKQEFIRVDTGDPITEPFNSVIMIEDVVYIDDETVEIIKSSAPWQHVRPIGEDIVANEMIVPSNHKIRPIDISAFLSGGVLEVNLFEKIKVGIIPTGDEIVEATKELEIGDIIDSNSWLFANMIKEEGAEPNIYPICKDNLDDLTEQIEKASKENHIVIVNAGSSAGREDYTSKAVERAGELIVHGVAVKPGKPTVLGMVNEIPVIGIPGYPVAAYMIFEFFVKTTIHHIESSQQPSPQIFKAYISKRIISSIKSLEFIPVKIGLVNNKYIATPLNRGSGVSMSLVRADGLLKIDKNLEGYEVGNEVEIHLFPYINNIENTLVSIGSHDLIMDVIGSIMNRDSEYTLSSSHVGSMGGIIALRRGEAHISPIHLLDEETGQYNVSSVKKYFEDGMILIKGVKRVQGLIIQKGNPKNIESLADLTKEGVSFVNRQRGAGTRILVDYMLKKLEISPKNITGYDREMSTHMSVASAVASGSADIGVGVYSAAKALGLDFIEIGLEDYDFVIEKELINDKKIQRFIKTLKNKEFHKQLEKFGGYEYSDSGNTIEIKI